MGCCGMCSRCTKISAWVFLVLGVIYLIADVTTWDFWGISWWTALFIVFGVIMFATNKCPDCNAMASKEKKK